MVGMPRFRQKRVKREISCQASESQPQFIKQFPRCIPYYSEVTEDTTKYHMPKWIPIYNESSVQLLFERFYLCPRPWRFQTAQELDGRWFQGLASAYSGGGHVADLGYNADDAYQVIDTLEINDWIDNLTAAVFVEFTTYEPASSLFNAVKLLFERFPNGGTNTIKQFKTLTVYSPQDPHFRGFYESCQLFFILLILCRVGTEIGKIYQHGSIYFRDPWRWLELLLLGCSLASLAMFFLKESYTSEFVKEVRKNPFQSWSTDNIALWSDVEVVLLSVVVFLVTMKMLRIIRFNTHIIQMRMTLGIAGKYFWSFSIVFIIVITAYVILVTLTFGKNIYEYHSFLQSFSSVLLMIIGGKAPFYKLRKVSFVIGPLFMFGYMVSIVMILLNMFLAILNDAYTESRERGQGGLEELELSNFLKRTAEKAVMKTKVAAIKVFQSLPTFWRQKESQLEKTLETDILIQKLGTEVDCDFRDDDKVTFRDLMKLLNDIKHDISSSVLSLDDIVPKVTIQEVDNVRSQSNYFTDEEGREEDDPCYSRSSLFSSQSDSAISKSDNRIYWDQDEKTLRSDSLIMDDWNRTVFLGNQEFV